MAHSVSFDIGGDSTATFQALTALTEKVDVGGVLLPISSVANKVCADWGMFVDDALSQVNEIFQGSRRIDALVIGPGDIDDAHAQANELVIGGLAATSPGLSILSSTSGQASLCFSDTSGVLQGYIKYDHSGDVMSFRTNGADRWQFTGSGNFIPIASGSYNVGGSSNRVNGIFGVSLDLSAAATVVGVTNSAAEFQTGIISPAALASGTTSNYAPTGFSTCNVIRQDVNAAGSSLDSLAGGESGRRVLLINISTTANLTLVNGVATANGFRCPNVVDCVIPPQGSRELWYDSTTSRWRVCGPVA